MSPMGPSPAPTSAGPDAWRLLLPHDVLARTAHRLVALDGQPPITVLVDRTGAYGRCQPDARRLWLADRAPLLTVPHEVAHLAHRSHGPAWEQEMLRLCRLLAGQ